MKNLIELAKQAGFNEYDTPHVKLALIERFATLVGNAKLEEAAKEAERMTMYAGGRQEAPAHDSVWHAARAIRNLKSTEPAERKAGCTLCGFCAATGERIKAVPEAQ